MPLEKVIRIIYQPENISFFFHFLKPSKWSRFQINWFFTGKFTEIYWNTTTFSPCYFAEQIKLGRTVFKNLLLFAFEKKFTFEELLVYLTDLTASRKCRINHWLVEETLLKLNTGFFYKLINIHNFGRSIYIAEPRSK